MKAVWYVSGVEDFNDMQMPLMKNGSDGQVICVNCGPIVSKRHENEIAPVDMREMKKESEENTSITSVMGDYLMKGWVMMNDCCATCNVPLLRTKDSSQVICVQCMKDYSKREEKALVKVDKSPAETTSIEISEMLREKVKMLCLRLNSLKASLDERECLEVLEKTMAVYQKAKELEL